MTKEEQIEAAWAVHQTRPHVVQIAEMRERRLAEQGGRCHYCEVEMNRDPRSEEYCTADHLQPKCRGGLDDIENIVACCAMCNSLKGSMTEAEYFESFSLEYRLAILRNEFRPYPHHEDVLRSGALFPQVRSLVMAIDVSRSGLGSIPEGFSN